jgi:hypothetical protein
MWYYLKIRIYCIFGTSVNYNNSSKTLYISITKNKIMSRIA